MGQREHFRGLLADAFLAVVFPSVRVVFSDELPQDDGEESTSSLSGISHGEAVAQEVTPPKFAVGQRLVHRKGGDYEVLEVPEQHKRLEATNEPYYKYKALVDGTEWSRSQAQMEDGRFLPVGTPKAALKLRVWWIPQVPMSPFLVDVDSVSEGVKMLDALARYDQFQYENRVKPDYSNAGGLEMFDPEDRTDGPDGTWTDWYDEDTGEDDPRAYLWADSPSNVD